MRPLKFNFRSTEGQIFYWSKMTADDSTKCQCTTEAWKARCVCGGGGGQNPEVCLQAFPSFLPQPLPALLPAPFFARSLTLVPPSLFLNCRETLATQATVLLDSHLLQRCNFTAMWYWCPPVDSCTSSQQNQCSTFVLLLSKERRTACTIEFLSENLCKSTWL